jgi:hypothetical protein
MPVLIAGLALPVSSALAGEDDGNSGKLHEIHNCLSGNRAKVTVTGSDVDSVAFYVDGRRVKTITRPTHNGTYVLGMKCRWLSPGTHRARAVATDTSGDRKTLRFTITRVAQSSPRFTG